MPDEEIDKLVRDAANQHHPPYDDTAWGKMGLLLDKHLPQKKDRKKPAILLLCFLLLGGTLFLAVENSHKKNTGIETANATDKKQGNNDNTVAATNSGQTSSSTATANDDNNTSGQPLNQTPGISTTAVAGKNKLHQNAPLQSNGGNKDQLYAKSKVNSYNQKGRTAIKVKRPLVTDGNDNPQEQTSEKEKTDVAGNTNVVIAAPKANEITVTAGPATTPNSQEPKVAKADSVNKPTTDTDKNTTVKNSTTATTKKKSTKSFGDKFAVTLSAGADMSFIDIQNAGKLKPAYGAGASYAVGKHITISSGLYYSKKIYTAAPYQYKFTGYVNPNLNNINADCKVLEIPVSVYYNFKQVKNHNWLGGISLSSLLMKRETYDYNYLTSSGQAYSYEKTVTNENKHYFSVLTLSGGYQYKLNNHLSFIAEPYLKIPLTGIGVGKIKLNSTGILVTAAIKPFAKKK
jgi:hypothetical protein